VVAAVNSAFLRLFGLSPDLSGPDARKIIGSVVATLGTHESLRVAAGVWRALGRRPERQHRCALSRDRVVTARWHRLPSDGVPLFAAVFADTAGDPRARRRLRDHNRALAEVVATKTELVSALLHELRTPLAAAMGMAQLLPERTGDELLDDALPLIVRKLRRIEEVTTEIATISAIENGTMTLDGSHVLVAEDNPVNQRVAQLLLERRGHRVELVADGAAAVDAVRRTPFDLVLMDVQMPVLDGLAATERIRADPPPHGPPRIVALTANGMREWIATMIHSPADRLKVAEILQHFAERLPGTLAKMNQAVERKDDRALARLAHGLKGVSATLGAGQFAALCAELENRARYCEPTEESLREVREMARAVEVAAGELAGSLIA
jgi:CheY-like chemotaxis protein